jgi:putrescine transport system permease protein
MVVFSSVRLGLSPEINALATILLGTVAVCVILAGLLIGRRETRK